MYFLSLFKIHVIHVRSVVAFRMFDTDESGKITKEKLLQFAESFTKLVGPLVTYTGMESMRLPLPKH